MLIDKLIELAPPPTDPLDRGSTDKWGAVTDFFGKALPTDYMSFVDRYGTVQLNDELQIFNPFSENPDTDLHHQFVFLLAQISQLKEEFPESCPYPLMFEPGGLLPWGITKDGDIFCWSTSGMSGKWTVVVLCRQYEPEEFDLSMVGFLVATIEGNIRSSAIPTNWADEPAVFA